MPAPRISLSKKNAQEWQLVTFPQVRGLCRPEKMQVKRLLRNGLNNGFHDAFPENSLDYGRKGTFQGGSARLPGGSGAA